MCFVVITYKAFISYMKELQLLALLKIVPWPGTSNEGYEQEKGNENTLKHLEGLEKRKSKSETVFILDSAF